MSPTVQVFVYPEELRFTSPRALVALLAELGCDAVSMALVYHRARRVFPRHRHVSTLPCTTAYFAPDRRRYGDLVPDAVADAELQELVLAFREECRRQEIRFGAWVVGLHHEGLALRRPRAASRTLDGSVLGHSLCPSAPEAVEYLTALAGDVAASVAPDAVDLEAWLYPAWEPSYTLTLALEQLSPEAELLATQCFCPHCRALFGDDADELCRRARAAAGRPFHDRAADEDGDIVGELEAVRATGAARLASAVAEAVHAEGVDLRLFASGSPAHARLQGLSPVSLEHADGLLLGCARLAGDELTARVEGLLEASGRRAATVSTNWTPQRSPESMAADVSRLAAAGADGLALYNLSLVPTEGLDAFRAAAAAFRAAVPPDMVVDGHVMIGASRDASLEVDDLLGTMERLGIDHAVISPPERHLPVGNREGNELVARAAAASRGRLLAYAVATPWLGAEAIEELERARDLGARALKLDPALQGLDLLDGGADPLISFAVATGWPVYVRTGTPPHSLPLQVALLASRFPDARFILGKSGATDFSHDGPAALAFAGNLYADSAHVEWPTALVATDAAAFGGRVVFTTDAPFASPAVELARVTEAGLEAAVASAVLGGTLACLLGL